jgi:Tol biopolymer transport system component
MQTICDLPDGNYSAGGWSQDDVIIFNVFPLFYRVPAAGGVAVALPTSDGQTIHSVPSFLPDGRHFIYLRDAKGSETAGTYLSSLDAKPDETPKRLQATGWEAQYTPTADPNLGSLLFLQEGTLMAQPFDNRRLELTGTAVPVAEQVGTSGGRWAAFSASTNGAIAYWRSGSSDLRNVQLNWRDQKGTSLSVVGDTGFYRGIALSPDSTLAALGLQTTKGQSDRASDIWLLDFSRGGSGTRFTYNGASGGVVWSTDGNRIVFGSRRDGAADLYEKPVNGTKDEEILLKTSDDKVPTSWSRDGLLLYTVSSSKTKMDIWVIQTSGDKKQIPFLQTTFNESEAQFSPDGHWVAYRSDKSGRDEVYVRAFIPLSASGSPIAGAEWTVSTAGGIQPKWRNDGKELFYQAPNGRLMAVDVTLGPAFHAGTPAVLFQSPRASNNAVVWDATSDGKRFLFAAQLEQSTPAPYTMVLNWQTGLKK